MLELHPRARFRKGQKVMTTQFYRSLVKMSLEYTIPPHTEVEVIETLFPDDMIDKTLVRCKNRAVGSFEFCVPEDILIPATVLGKLIYG